MEQPVDLKPRKGKARKGATPKDKRICIIHMASINEKDVRYMKEEGFEKIKDVAKIRFSQVDQNIICSSFTRQSQKMLLNVY